MSAWSILATALLLIATTSAAMATEAVSGSCPITFPQGGMYGNEALQAVLPGGGKFVFKPGGAGFVDRDGALHQVRVGSSNTGPFVRRRPPPRRACSASSVVHAERW